MNLVIVESPAKANTIKKYLGKDFEVLASYGHVRDLVPKEGAVDTDGDFAMKYQPIERNEKHVTKIARALKKSDALYIATDPDREGEAIAWHLLELLKEKNLVANKEIRRVVFNEITKSAVQEAIASPREVASPLVDAQQARRALDYLVGFNLSPLLWRKVQRGLSAGRVQSPALRLIAEREAEIDAFVPREYWSIEAQAEKDATKFPARLYEVDGNSVEQFSFVNAEQAGNVESRAKAAANGQLLISKVKKSQRRRNPAPPFITSTLQQEAARKLGFTAMRTMRTAQQLYEGVELDGEHIGLITYMRTDSVSLSQEALADIRGEIGRRYGDSEVPESPRFYKTKSKNAQEAHEAIRPSSATRSPEKVRAALSPDQAKLYELIWKRALACQMNPAVFDTVQANLDAGDGIVFRASGSTMVEPGFMAVYQEGKDDNANADKTKDSEDGKTLPPLEEGEKVSLLDVVGTQHFTEPPPRFTEASLVKTLEEYDIGRPSTYASIISTLLNREYVELESKRFTPTDVGKIVNRFLTEHFEQYVDYGFTANLEDQLDAVSRGEKEWIPLLEEFWKPFKARCDEKQELSREEVAQARQLGTDPKSGKPVSVRIGRWGAFVQIGTKDDEDKPKFAGLRPGQKLDSITFEEAMELFKLPRALGETPEGEKVSTNIGRFGPYVRYADKYASIKDDADDPYTLTLERALEIVAQKKADDLAKIIKTYNDGAVQILKGRWGPYITDGNKNARIPKDQHETAGDLTLEQCLAMLEAAPERKGRGRKGATKKAAPKKKAPAKKTTAKKKPAKKKAAAKKPAAKKTAAKKTPKTSD